MSTVAAMKKFEDFIDECGARQKSIPHDEAMAQDFAEHPKRAVEMVHALSQMANDFEEECEYLKRQVEFLANELARWCSLYTPREWIERAERETK